MTNISFHLLDVLPSNGIEGAVYFVRNGKLFVATSDTDYLEISPIEFVNTLPSEGIANKLYALTDSGQIKLNYWIQGEGFKEVVPNIELATTTTDGLMSSLDKAKLNGIAEGATKTIIENTLESQSATSALSANQGRVLNSVLDLHKNTLASTGGFGHVKVDGTSIIASPEGVISVNPEYIDPAELGIKKSEYVITVKEENENDFPMPDEYQTNPSAYVEFLFYETLKVHESEYNIFNKDGVRVIRFNTPSNKVGDLYNLILLSDKGLSTNSELGVLTINGEHPDANGNFDIPHATDSTHGHVKVDGTTITANNGVISANVAPHQYKIIAVDATVAIVAGATTAEYDFGSDFAEGMEWTAFDYGMRLFSQHGSFSFVGTKVIYTMDEPSNHDTNITLLGEKIVAVV